jgi:diguanylate cyclase (GGDEF)-like protein/PAS domain S-box-containing protein
VIGSNESSVRFLRRKPLDERPRRALTVASGLFAAIFALRFAATTTADAVTFLYVIPIVLVAIAFGERGGFAAAILAFALSVVWTVVDGVAIGPLGYAVRAAVFLLIGSLVGRFATSLRALHEESAKHFNLSQDLICTAGTDGYFKRVNASFERVLGYSEEELLSRPYVDFVHPDDLERTVVEAAAVPDGRGAVQFQNRYVGKEGEVHWLEWTSTSLADEGLIYAVAREITDRKVLEQELERLSQHDSLTGLFNRHRFEEELERQLIYTRRYGRGGALLVLDLDRFKQINDELGHAAGDRALCEVAGLLRENLRASDTVARDSGAVVARLGGDEFVVLLPEVDADGARAAAERLVAALEDYELAIDGRDVKLKASVGIALFDEHGRPPAGDLLAAADKAMYAAKVAGGAGVSLIATPR